MDMDINFERWILKAVTIALTIFVAFMCLIKFRVKFDNFGES